MSVVLSAERQASISVANASLIGVAGRRTVVVVVVVVLVDGEEELAALGELLGS